MGGSNGGLIARELFINLLEEVRARYNLITLVCRSLPDAREANQLSRRPIVMRDTKRANAAAFIRRD